MSVPRPSQFDDPDWISKFQSSNPPPQPNPPLEEEASPQSPEEAPPSIDPGKGFQKRAEKALRSITAVDLDLGKVADWEYLEDIFSERYDSYHSLAYLRKVHEKLKGAGYPDGPMLNTMAFLSVIVRRLQIVYQEHHVLLKRQGVARPEDLQLLKEIQDIGRLMGDLQKTMDTTVLKQREFEDVYSLTQASLDDAGKFVQEHLGEYSIRCRGCGSVMTLDGLPHWAILTSKSSLDGSPVYHAFSQEIWYCVERGLVPLHLAAFFLHTSIEGLTYTAKSRQESFQPDLTIHKLEQEEVLLAKLRGPYEEQETIRQRDRQLI